MLTFDDLDGWIGELRQVDGVRSAELDPAQVKTPGVWVRLPSFGIDTLAAGNYRLDVELNLVVGDQDWRKARNELAAIFDAVHGFLGRPRIPQVQFIKLVLPEAEVPCLRFTTTLRLTLDD